MSNDINLLHTTAPRVSVNLLKKVHTFRIISMCALFLVCVISGMLFILTVFSPLNELKKEEQALIAEFSASGLQSKTDSYFLTKVRAEDITKLLANRSTMVDLYNSLNSVITSSVSLEEVKINRDEVLFEARSPSLVDIEQVIKDLAKIPKENKSVDSINLSEVAYDSNVNSYTVKVDIDLKEKI